MRTKQRTRLTSLRVQSQGREKKPPFSPFPVVFPGLSSGRFKPLTDSEIERIYAAAKSVLQEIGIGDPPRNCIELVRSAGGWMNEHRRLCFPGTLVDDIVDKANKEVILCGFDPRFDLELTGTKVHLGTGGAAVEMLDSFSFHFRPSTLLDIFDLGRVVDACDNFHWYLRMVVARDIDDLRELDINTAYAAMMSTSKHIGTSFSSPETVQQVVGMFDTALGGEGQFRKRPFCHAVNCFIVPPLRFAAEACACLEEQVRQGMPIALISASQVGATSPASLTGALVQGLAECLSGLCYVNLLQPKHPALVGLWLLVSDLRSGSMSGGSGEGAIVNAASAQIVNWLGLPSAVPAGMTDSKAIDGQSGSEKAYSVAMSALAGANMTYEAGGMLASLMGASLEALVIDNDTNGAILRSVRGIEVTEDELSLDVIRDTVLGEGHFLCHPQTLLLMRSNYLYPAINDRRSIKEWLETGEVSQWERAHKRVCEILAEAPATHVSRTIDENIRCVLPIRLPLEEINGHSERWKGKILSASFPKGIRR